jgi:hypothetical protein
MLVAPINGLEMPERPSPADDAVDPPVIARMEKLREQGFSFRSIAAVLMKQGLTFSAERVKEILEVHHVSEQKK